MKRTLLASILFIILLLSGGVWIWLARYVSPGVLRDMIIPAVGFFFAAIFVSLLIVRVRLLLRAEGTLRSGILFGALEFSLFVGAFAWIHTELGLIEVTSPAGTVIHSFPASVYFTILNFTSLGAEDLIATPDSRFLVAIESFVGYLLLATIAATTVTVISRSHAPDDNASSNASPTDDNPRR